MKKRVKKLKMTKETLANLDKLSKVVGGGETELRTCRSVQTSYEKYVCETLPKTVCKVATCIYPCKPLG